jgi:hypothetical protein
MATLHIPDVSEFQPDVDWSKINHWNGGAAIIRAAYGDAHVDHAWNSGVRRKAFWDHGGEVLGIYQYLVADQDPRTQAQALAVILDHHLKPGEFLVCDAEEGTGDQGHRYKAWRERLNELGIHYPGYHGDWIYSSDYFMSAHGLSGFAGRRHWIAAYQADEPRTPHLLWQFTDSAVMPGIPQHADCSVFHGTITEFSEHVHDGKQKPHPTHHTDHQPPAKRHPFARLKVDGDLGPITCAALNYWLGVRINRRHWTEHTTRRLQAKIGTEVTGHWTKQYTGTLKEWLSHHGIHLKVSELNGAWDPVLIAGLQRFLNEKVGHYT